MPRYHGKYKRNNLGKNNVFQSFRLRKKQNGKLTL